MSTLVPPLPSKLAHSAKSGTISIFPWRLLTGKLFRRQSSMANTVDSKLIGIPEAIRLEFLINFYGTTPNTKHIVNILLMVQKFSNNHLGLMKPVVNTKNFNYQPPSTGEWVHQISKHIKPHLEVSIALSYSPQRGESCSPVFRQRFGRGYAHPKYAPQETTPFSIVREKQHKPLMFQSRSKDYNVYLYTYTLTFAVTSQYSILNTTFLGIYSLNIKDKQLNGKPFEEKCAALSSWRSSRKFTEAQLSKIRLFSCLKTVCRVIRGWFPNDQWILVR